MGVYELMEGKVVNGRGVWQMAGGQKYFMYYGSRPGNFFGSIMQWGISDRADMEAGKAAVLLYVASTALTPDQVTETWHLVDMVTMAFVHVPKVKARM